MIYRCHPAIRFRELEVVATEFAIEKCKKPRSENKKELSLGERWKKHKQICHVEVKWQSGKYLQMAGAHEILITQV